MPGTLQVLNKYSSNEQTTEKFKLKGHAVFKEWTCGNIRDREVEGGEYASDLGL